MSSELIIDANGETKVVEYISPTSESDVLASPLDNIIQQIINAPEVIDAIRQIVETQGS